MSAFKKIGLWIGTAIGVVSGWCSSVWKAIRGKSHMFLALAVLCLVAACAYMPKPAQTTVASGHYEKKQDLVLTPSTQPAFQVTPPLGGPPITSGTLPPSQGTPQPGVTFDGHSVQFPGGPSIVVDGHKLEWHSSETWGQNNTNVTDADNSKNGMKTNIHADGSVDQTTTGTTPPPAASQALKQLDPLVWIGAGLIVIGALGFALKSQPWMAWMPARVPLYVILTGVALLAFPFILEKYSWLLVVGLAAFLIYEAWSHGLFKKAIADMTSPTAQKNAALDGNPEAAGPLEFIRTGGDKDAAKRAQLVATKVAVDHGTLPDTLIPPVAGAPVVTVTPAK